MRLIGVADQNIHGQCLALIMNFIVLTILTVYQLGLRQLCQHTFQNDRMFLESDIMRE